MKLLMVLLILLGIIISSIEERSIKKKLMVKLLKFKVAGDEEHYLKLLSSRMMAISFSKLNRQLMELTYYLTFYNENKIKNVLNRLDCSQSKFETTPALQKAYLEVYLTFLEKDSITNALEIEKNFLNLSKDSFAFKQSQILHRIYVDKDPKLVSILEQRLKETDNNDEKIVIYQRLAKLNELLGNKNKSNYYLTQMRNFNAAFKEIEYLN